MKATFVNFQVSIESLINKINWLRASGRYVVRDPNTKDLLLYLDEKHYNKLVITAMSNDVELDVLSTPDDDESSVRSRFPSTDKGSKETPPLDSWISNNSKLLTLISGWRIKESMIEFERNFDQFIPLYYRDIMSWLGLPLSRFGMKNIWRLSKSLNKRFTTRGINQVILTLKIDSIVVLQYIAGTPMTTTQGLGQRVKLVNGLPAHLPSYFRSFIRNGDTNKIRVLNTLLSAYKGFSGIYKDPSFDSIKTGVFRDRRESFIRT